MMRYTKKFKAFVILMLVNPLMWIFLMYSMRNWTNRSAPIPLLLKCENTSQTNQVKDLIFLLREIRGKYPTEFEPLTNLDKLDQAENTLSFNQKAEVYKRLMTFLGELSENNKNSQNTSDTRSINEDQNCKSATRFPNYLCIYLRPGPGLGNQLYMIASAYALAKIKGMRLVVTGGLETLNTSFKLDAQYETDTKLCSCSVNVTESACCRLSPNIVNISNKISVTVSVYLQSYKYFDKHGKDIRRMLTFSDTVLNLAKVKLEKLLLESQNEVPHNTTFNRTLVGIHIRRGDYSQPHRIKFGYRMATKEYINQAQDYMRNKFSNVIFIVCTNGVEWANETFKDQVDVIIAPIGQAGVDMALLTLLDHIIITVGTFGFWAAWLNPKNSTVIYYKDFITPGSEYSQGFANPNTDTYPPHWIGM